jgi:nicotinamidase/pyrazinamidase
MTATERSALLVVDVQNDFCPGGALAVPHGDRVVPALNKRIAEAQSQGWPIYASRDWHPPETRHFKRFGGEWPDHCVQQTPGAEFHPQLQLPPTAVVISKGQNPEDHGYSAFSGQLPDGRSLLADLNAHGIDHLYVGGLATDYCVKQSVLDALRAGLRVTVLSDAIEGVNVREGDAAQALEDMRAAGAEVL